jgi:hypothetical protein
MFVNPLSKSVGAEAKPRGAAVSELGEGNAALRYKSPDVAVGRAEEVGGTGNVEKSGGSS